MADYRQAAARIAQRHGIPVGLFSALIHQESGWNPRARSPVGARGLGQLMPATARSLGVNPDDPIQNLEGAARYLSKAKQSFGNWKLALAAYNAGFGAVHKYGGVPPYAETQNYVRTILSHAGVSHGVQLPGGVLSPVAGTSPGLGQYKSQLARVQRLNAALAPSPLVQNILQRSVGERTAGLLSPIQLPLPKKPSGILTDLALPGITGKQLPALGKALGRYVTLAPGADRPGVHTQPAVLQFVGNLGRLAGRRLTIGTGSEHSRMTVNGRVSDHWSGHAADIPASGAKLRKLGYLALIEAGMGRAQAARARQTGGLFNVGRYQIIFATTEGGNHFNHLHVGVRG